MSLPKISEPQSYDFPKIDIDYYRNLKGYFKTRQQQYYQGSDQSMNKLKQVLSTNFQKTKSTISTADQFVVQGKEQIIRLKQSIKDKKQMQTIETKWLNTTKQLLQITAKTEQKRKEYTKSLKKSAQDFNKIVKNFQKITNKKEQRKAKIQQFRSLQTPNISVRTRQPYQRRIFTPNNKQPYPKHEVEFKPESGFITFRIETFEGKIVEFVLFYDKVEKKFGLKNPWKNFQAQDFMVVRAFNIHLNIAKSLEEFRSIVIKYIDDADDLPQYEG